MAIALEELTPAASSAVSAAAAGHGSRLSPEVSRELKAKAAKAVVKGAAKVSAPATSAARPPTHVAAGVVRGAAALNNQGAQVISGGKGGMAARIIFAFGAGLLALEIASYLSGRYFTYHVGQGVQKMQTASQHLGLYPGQTAKLAAVKKAEATALPMYAGTGTL